MKTKLFLKTIAITIFITLFLGALILTAKGNIGSPIFYQKEHDTRVGGPFEASNSTSRYALTQSIVENKSFFLTKDLASFASPDVTDYKSRFISIFTPGISFIGVPFYMLGAHFGLPQLFTYFPISLFAILNILLITIIVKKLGGTTFAGLLSGFIFAFATNAFPYSLTFTQHIVSVSIILMALINAMSKRNIINNVIFGLLAGASLLVDIPNLFLMFPIGIYILSQHFQKEQVSEKMKINIKISFITIAIGLLPLIAAFGIYNHKTAESYTKIAQSIGRSSIFNTPISKTIRVDEVTKVNTEDTNRLSLPFNTRLMLGGTYTLLISNERSWIYYCPVILFGILGLALMYLRKEKKSITAVMISILLINIILYSMFGDPWGGWAFGPRYLIPGAAILSIGISELLRRYGRNILFIIVFIPVLFYSIFISTLGATTTNSIPPKIEAVSLATKTPYTYEYNLDLLNDNKSSSLVYNYFLAGSMDAKIYTYILATGLMSIGVLLYLLAAAENKNTSLKINNLKNKLSRGRKNV